MRRANFVGERVVRGELLGRQRRAPRLFPFAGQIQMIIISVVSNYHRVLDQRELVGPSQFLDGHLTPRRLRAIHRGLRVPQPRGRVQTERLGAPRACTRVLLHPTAKRDCDSGVQFAPLGLHDVHEPTLGLGRRGGRGGRRGRRSRDGGCRRADRSRHRGHRSAPRTVRGFWESLQNQKFARQFRGDCSVPVVSEC